MSDTFVSASSPVPLHAPGCSYLCLGQVELAGELRALPAHHVLAPLELQLQPVQLLRRERGARALGPVQVQALGQHDLPDGAFGVCPGRTRREGGGWGGGQVERMEIKTGAQKH